MSAPSHRPAPTGPGRCRRAPDRAPATAAAAERTSRHRWWPPGTPRRGRPPHRRERAPRGRTGRWWRRRCRVVEFGDRLVGRRQADRRITADSGGRRGGMNRGGLAEPGRGDDGADGRPGAAERPNRVGLVVLEAGRFCGSGPAIRTVIAPAGFGKTTTVHAAAVAAAAAGHPVVGLAATNQAAGELRHAAHRRHDHCPLRPRWRPPPPPARWSSSTRCPRWPPAMPDRPLRRRRRTRRHPVVSR